jgi:hypothetical protein
MIKPQNVTNIQGKALVPQGACFEERTSLGNQHLNVINSLIGFVFRLQNKRFETNEIVQISALNWVESLNGLA